MYDIHTHIIPNVDDGSKSLEISRTLILDELKNNIKDIILTPHQNELEMDKEKITNAYNKLKEDVKDLEANLYLGSEVYYYNNICDDIENGKITTMNNSKFVLVEFSVINKTDILDICYDFKSIGYIPIIAHIERYPYLSFEEIKEISKVAKIQVNCHSFLKKDKKKLIKFLLKNNLIDYIGTDCHDLKGRNVNYEGVLKFAKKYPKFKEKIEQKPEFI